MRNRIIGLGRGRQDTNRLHKMKRLKLKKSKKSQTINNVVNSLGLGSGDNSGGDLKFIIHRALPD